MHNIHCSRFKMMLHRLFLILHLALVLSRILSMVQSQGHLNLFSGVRTDRFTWRAGQTVSPDIWCNNLHTACPDSCSWGLRSLFPSPTLITPDMLAKPEKHTVPLFGGKKTQQHRGFYTVEGQAMLKCNMTQFWAWCFCLLACKIFSFCSCVLASLSRSAEFVN